MQKDNLIKFFIFLFFFLNYFIRSSAQEDTSFIHYESEEYNYQVDFPQDWDSTYLQKIKAQIHAHINLLFAAKINPSFHKNGIGGIFMINIDTFPNQPDSLELLMLKNNAEDYFKDSNNGKLQTIKIFRTNKTKLPCIMSLVRADFGGIPSFVYNVGIYKDGIRYTLTLNCHEIAYLKLKESFEKVVDSFQ